MSAAVMGTVVTTDEILKGDVIVQRRAEGSGSGIQEIRYIAQRDRQKFLLDPDETILVSRPSVDVPPGMIVKYTTTNYLYVRSDREGRFPWDWISPSTGEVRETGLLGDGHVRGSLQSGQATVVYRPSK